MSLFGDLPNAKNDTTPGPPSLFARRTLVPPPSILRNKTKRKGESGNDLAVPGSGPTLPEARGLFSAFGTIEDEYDPAVPNEYMKAKEQQEEAVLKAEMEARKAAEEREAVCIKYFCMWLTGRCWGFGHASVTFLQVALSNDQYHNLTCFSCDEKRLVRMNSTESIKEGLTRMNDEPIESLTQVSL
jgi:hypothetical protein